MRATSETYQLRIDHVDGPKDYDSLLRDKLQELRDEFEEEAENAKEELEAAYRSKVNFAKFKIIALLFFYIILINLSKNIPNLFFITNIIISI